MNAHWGAVYHANVAVMRSGHCIHEKIPNASLCPTPEAVIAGSVRSVALRQITPRRTGSQNPEDAIENTAVVHARNSAWFIGQQRFNCSPFEVSQIISAHLADESH